MAPKLPEEQHCSSRGACKVQDSIYGVCHGWLLRALLVVQVHVIAEKNQMSSMCLRCRDICLEEYIAGWKDSLRS